MIRRRALLATPALLAAPAWAQGFPERSLRLIVPYAAGTSSDIQGRLIAARMTDALIQPFVVENRAGGGGTLGAELVAKAKPDGHTLLLGSNGPLTVNPVLQAKLPYDVETELAPIALLSRSPLTLVVRADAPWADVAALVAAAKAAPGTLTIGSSGQGSATHFLIEQFQSAAGIRFTHVPYRGSSQSVPDLIAGNVQVVMGEVSTTTPSARGGLVRVLATTGPTRSALLPDRPTLEEAGYPGLIGGSFAALMTTGGTPAPVIATLLRAVRTALEDPTYRTRQTEVGAEIAEPALRAPDTLAAWLRSERARTKMTADAAGIRAE